MLATLVSCTQYVTVPTPEFRGDPHDQLSFFLYHWFPTSTRFWIEALPLTTTLREHIESELRQPSLTNHRPQTISERYTDKLHFLELGSSDPNWRLFFVPLFSDRWLRGGYSTQITRLGRHTGSNLFLLFRAPSDAPRTGENLAKIHTVGVIKGIQRNFFEEKFRPPNEADNLDLFWLNHIPTYSAESFQMTFTALHVHP